MSRVLLVGEDDALLQTRAAVVRTAGAEAICCRPDAVPAILAEQVCELAILCHSLSEERCAGLIRTIHECWPATALFVVSAVVSDPRPAEDPSFVTVTSAEPELLVLHVLDVLHSRRAPQSSHLGRPLGYLATGSHC